MTAEFTPLSAAVGGALIGLASSVVLASQGRIAGVSGIVGNLLRPLSKTEGWQVAFVAGLVIVGVLAGAFFPEQVTASEAPAIGWIVVAGLLVGYGTRLGNGCTSGHGVCGTSRLSRRSIVATLTFIASGAVTVILVRALLHGGNG